LLVICQFFYGATASTGLKDRRRSFFVQGCV